MNFLNRILNYLLFAGTSFFAAGAVATGAGAATGSPATTGGTGGSDAGSSDGGAITWGGGGEKADAGTTEADASKVADAEITTEADDFGDFGDDVFDDPAAETTAQQAEEFGPQTYQKLKKALSTDPALFKEVKKGLSMLKRFTEHFESPEKASELLTTLHGMGGIEEIQKDMGETATFLTGFNAGDEGVISSWMQENAEGIPKAMPVAFDAWYKHDPQGWGHYQAKAFMATLDQAPSGGISALAAFNTIAKQFPDVAKSPEFQRIAEVVNRVQEIAGKAPEVTAKVNDSKLTQREQQLRQQEQQLKVQALGGKATPILSAAANSALKTVLGARKVSPEARKDLLSDIHKEFARINEKDVQGKKNRLALLSAGQDEQWLKSVKSVADRNMVQAARNVLRKYNSISGISKVEADKRKVEAQSRVEAGAGASQGSLKQESPAPNGSNVDWDRMRAEFGGRDKADDAFNGWLKSGQYAGKRVWFKKNDAKTVYVR